MPIKSNRFSGFFIFLLFLSFFGSAFTLQPMPAGKNNHASIGTCPMFPENNFWNVPVNDLPVHAQSAAWVNSIGNNTSFHMDFGSGTWDGGAIGIPYNILSGASVNFYNFDFYYPDQSDAGPYPLPASPLIEWGSDHHILTVNTDDCTLYEVYDASKVSGSWFGGSGAVWNLNNNDMRTDTWTSADAAGLPILPGLIRYDEVAASVINHALRFTANCTADYYIWPARHVAKHGTCANPVPFGARFRLKANFDISSYSPHAQVILQAFKTYGIVLADNGSNWYVSGAPSESWHNDVLHELDALHGSNFEVVDTSGLMVDANSAATNYAVNPPEAFAKSNPANNSTSQPTSLNLSWNSSAGAASYEYCYDTSNDNTCAAWASNNTSTTKSISGLSYDTAYYWHVRAVNSKGTTYSDTDTWWKFTTGHPPLSFNKTSPADLAARAAINPTLSWETSVDASSYEYCINTTSIGCATWINVGGTTSASPATLQPNTTYYWNVRAKNNVGTTLSANAIRSFTTGPIPAAFTKVAPTDSSVNLPAGISLSWNASSDLTIYEYCIDTTNDNTCQSDLWVNVNTDTNADLSGTLAANTNYYWQVRALNAFGARNADAGSWWTFKTMPLPAAFIKSAPANGSITLPLTPTLNWNASANTIKYEYCIYETNNGTCSWVNNNALTSVTIAAPLLKGTEYSWQARAVNSFGNTYANGNSTSIWSFTTGDVPAAFTKNSPLNNALNQPLSLSLKWNASDGLPPVQFYEYCINTTPTCNSGMWKNTGLNRSVDIRGLLPVTTYYWQVRTVNDFGTTYASSGWRSFTTAELKSNSLPSTAINDGWVLESREFSNTANIKNSIGTLRVGDDAKNRQYRSLLYFDTASLPKNAIISKALVKIKMSSVVEDITPLGDLIADMKKGTFGLAPLELADFSAIGAPINIAGRFANNADTYTLTLNPAYFKYINLYGVTQFRIRFTKDDDNDITADFINFYGDGSPDAPQFIIEYTTP